MKNKRSDAIGSAVKDQAFDWKWKGTWNEFVGKSKQVWGNVVTRDIDDVNEGQFQEAFGRLQRSTGESMDSIRRKLHEDDLIVRLDVSQTLKLRRSANTLLTLRKPKCEML